MTESDKPQIHEESDPPAIEAVRTEEPQAPFGQDEPNPNVVSDATADEKGGEQDPPPGGYGGRDPKSEMPSVPSVPETTEDAPSHGGEPKTDKEPPASTNRV